MPVTPEHLTMVMAMLRLRFGARWLSCDHVVALAALVGRAALETATSADELVEPIVDAVALSLLPRTLDARHGVASTP